MSLPTEPTGPHRPATPGAEPAPPEASAVTCPPPPSDETGITRNAATVSAATLLSRLLGFVRDCTIAAILGAGPLADAFFIALRLPNLMRRLFGEGSLSLALISEYSHVRAGQGDASAHAMARACAVWLLLILGLICLAATTWPHGLTTILAPGFADTPELLDRTARLVQLCFPYALLICVTALCAAVLQAQGHFLRPALAPAMLNIWLIAGAAVAWLFDWPVPETLGYSLLGAGVAQIAMLQPQLARQGFRWTGPYPLHDRSVRRVGTLMLPSVFGAAVYQLSIVLVTMLASLLPQGSIAHLYYADRLVQFPLGVFGIAVGTAALPALATLAATGEHARFRNALSATLRLTLFISLPAAAGLAGLAEPIVSLLFGRGAFDAQDVAGTVAALWGYAAGLPAFSASRPLLAAFHASRDTRTPVVAAMAGLAVTLLCGVILMQYMGHAGLAVAVSLGSWANTGALFALFTRRSGRFFVDMPWLVWYTLLSLLILAGTHMLSGLSDTAWSLCAIPLIIALYVLAAIVTGSPDATLLLRGKRDRNAAT